MTRARPITAFIAAVYILAAVRALVPGLCQTQRAALETLRQASCCSAEPCSSDAGDGPTLRDPAKPRTPCPLCLMAAAPREPLQRVTVMLDSVAGQPVEAAFPSVPRLPLFPLSDLGRSPPTHA